MTSQLFCSTIIPTIGRASLDRAVMSVLGQECDGQDFEVIVVNDSRKPLSVATWMQSERVQIIETNQRNRSVARNVGAATARGCYLHFLDDDDYMLPDALLSLWQVAKTNPAAWIYGGYELVDRQGTHLEMCRPDERGNCSVRFAASEWLPLQASLIRSDAFFAVGGFAPLDSLLGGDEDVDLARQISLRYEIAGTLQPVAVIQFGHEGSTTNYAALRQQSRISREKMLTFPGVANRLLDSARHRFAHINYWHGRVLWCYLGSIHWNLKRRRLFTAVSRLFFAFLIFFISGWHIFSRHFWHGVAGRPLVRGWLATGQPHNASPTSTRK